jgi:hypothetical protein
MTRELKACPFCGSSETEVIVDDEEWQIARVECRNPGCRASGPHLQLGDFRGIGERQTAIGLWNTRSSLPNPEGMTALHIVFDGPPGPGSGRFVEVETSDGRSINAGEWRERADGLWELRIAALSTRSEGQVTDE